jgi:predicted nucleotidyltransferase
MVAVTRALPPAVEAALDRLRGALRERFGARVSELVLFGSHARGDAHEESDVDVLVAIDGLSEEDRLAVLDFASLLDSAAPEWVGLSPLVYSSEQAARMRAGGRRLFRDIDREGIRL